MHVSHRQLQPRAPRSCPSLQIVTTLPAMAVLPRRATWSRPHAQGSDHRDLDLVRHSCSSFACSTMKQTVLQAALVRAAGTKSRALGAEEPRHRSERRSKRAASQDGGCPSERRQRCMYRESRPLRRRGARLHHPNHAGDPKKLLQRHASTRATFIMSSVRRQEEQ